MGLHPLRTDSDFFARGGPIGGGFLGLYCYIGVIRYVLGPILGPKVRPGPRYNDQNMVPIYLNLFLAKVCTQYIYFATIFLNILGAHFMAILGVPTL